MWDEVCQVLLGEDFVDDWLKLLMRVACFLVCLFQGGDVVWYSSLWVGGLKDDVKSGLKRVEKRSGGASTLCRSDLPQF